MIRYLVLLAIVTMCAVAAQALNQNTPIVIYDGVATEVSMAPETSGDLWVTLVALLLMVAVSSPALGQPKAASMKGRVFFSDLNEPSPNALVVLKNQLKPDMLETRTDDQGKYNFPGVDGGVYTISIRAPYNRQEASCHLGLQNGQALSVASSKDRFEAIISGFNIRAGKAIVKDFDFACKPNPIAANSRKEITQPALEMLKKKKVPFDQNLLIDDLWRRELAEAFAQMPEMKKQMRVTSPMSGVYLAGTILLPARVELKGDTVMLVGEFAPIDESLTISITGPHRLFIFVIGDQKQYEAMSRRQGSQFLTVDVTGPCGVSGIAPVFRTRVFRCGRIWWDSPGNAGLAPR